MTMSSAAIGVAPEAVERTTSPLLRSVTSATWALSVACEAWPMSSTSASADSWVMRSSRRSFRSI